MTGLPQDFVPKKAPRVQYAGIEERRAAYRIDDAAVYQRCAAANMAAVTASRLNGRHLAGTERIATEFYAYARYLMGIDDYWLSIPSPLVRPRVDR